MKTKYNLYLSSFLLLALVLVSGCQVLQQRIAELRSFSQCKFRIGSVSNIRLVGVDVQRINSINSLNFGQVASLTAAYLSKNIPLSFTLNIEAQNPTPQLAAIGGFQWVLLIDGHQYLTGTNPSRVSINPNGGTAAIPMQINLELFSALSGKSKDVLLNFGMALAGTNGQSTRIALRIKPTFIINGYVVDYPNFIEIGKDFKALN